MRFDRSEKIMLAGAATVAAGTLIAWYAGGGAKALYDFEVNEYSTESKKIGGWIGAYIGMPLVLTVASGAVGFFCGGALAYCMEEVRIPRWIKSCWQQENMPDPEQNQAPAPKLSF